MGYGAMQLAGPGVFGPPNDREQATAVLREAIELGVTHIDTSDYYGPATVNEVIKEALQPYPDDLHIVTTVGARRPPDGSWVPAHARDELIGAVHDNLEHLGLDVLDVVNLRTSALDGPTDESLAEPFSVLAELQQEGLIRHLGLSGVSSNQLTEAQSIAPVVTVQNLHKALLEDQKATYEERNTTENPAFLDELASKGIFIVPTVFVGAESVQGFRPNSLMELLAA